LSPDPPLAAGPRRRLPPFRKPGGTARLGLAAGEPISYDCSGAGPVRAGGRIAGHRTRGVAPGRGTGRTPAGVAPAGPSTPAAPHIQRRPRAIPAGVAREWGAGRLRAAGSRFALE